MALFKKPQLNFIGVDLGGSVIKLVELKNLNGKAELVTYGFAEKPIDLVSGDYIDKPKELSEILKDLCDKSKVQTKKAVTALPTPSVFSSIISLPNLTKEDASIPRKVEAAVRWEAKKVVPLPLDDMIIDYKFIPVREQEKKQQATSAYQVLLTGAAKKLVKKYMEVFTEAGLDLVSLETEAFALIRSLIGPDKSVIMIVDIGAINTYIIIVDNGVPFLDRTINTGGFNITKTISESLNITLDKAEQFKRDLAISPFAKDKKLPKIIENTLTPILHEIKYTFNLYTQDQFGGKNIEKIILTGGSVLIPNLPEYLSEILNTRVYLGDPWARVIYPEDLKPILNEIGSQFASCVGLAMRDIE